MIASDAISDHLENAEYFRVSSTQSKVRLLIIYEGLSWLRFTSVAPGRPGS